MRGETIIDVFEMCEWLNEILSSAVPEGLEEVNADDPLAWHCAFVSFF
jgi:hypothetical protein